MINVDSINTNINLFAIVESDGRSFVDLSQVVRLIADGTCTWVLFSNGKKVLTTKNLGYYEKILPIPQLTTNNRFFRVHYKHLINLSYMKKYNRKDKVIHLHSDDYIPVAQRRVKGFTSMLRSFSLY